MWKRIVAIVLVLIALAYSFLWFRHAGETEKQMAALLDSLSGEQAQAAGVSITYDGISVGGFPFEFVTHITNPKVSIDSAKLIQNIGTMKGLPTPPALGDVPMLDTTQLKGEVQISANYFTRTLGFAIDATSEGESHVGGKTMHWANKNGGQANCKVTLGPDANMSMLQKSVLAPFDNVEALVKSFRSINCLADPMEITNTDSDSMLYRGGEQLFSVSFEEMGANDVHINALLTSNDLEISDDWKAWMDNIMQVVNPRGFNAGVLPINSYEATGKQNTEVKLSYRGPVNFENLQNSEIELHIPTFKISNNLYSISYPINFNLSKKGEQVTGDISINGSATYDPAIDEYADKTVDQAVASMFSTDANGNPHPLSPILGAADQESLTKNIKAVLPAFGSFKTWNSTVEASFKSTENKELHQTNGEATIRSIAMRFGDYGLSATGSASFMPPRGEISLRCHKCHDTMDKLVIFASNLQKLVALVSPGVPPLPEGIAFRDAIAGFVESISTPADDMKDDRVILISNSGNGETVISGKPMQEVTMQAMQTLMPFFMPQQPQGGAQ